MADADHAAGARTTLEGWIPDLAHDQEIRAALERAFEFRGDVSITLKDGGLVEGYVYDRRLGPTLADCAVRVLPPDDHRVTIPFTDIAALEFSGKDCAAGKSFETWIRRYAEKKRAEQQREASAGPDA